MLTGPRLPATLNGPRVLRQHPPDRARNRPAAPLSPRRTELPAQSRAAPARMGLWAV